MKLKIKPTTGGETFEVEVGSASDTIAEVKSSVSSETGAALNSIRLIYKGKPTSNGIHFNFNISMSLYCISFPDPLPRSQAKYSKTTVQLTVMVYLMTTSSISSKAVLKQPHIPPMSPPLLLLPSPQPPPPPLPFPSHHQHHHHHHP